MSNFNCHKRKIVSSQKLDARIVCQEIDAAFPVIDSDDALKLIDQLTNG